MLTTEEWLDHARQTRLFGPRPNCHTGSVLPLETRLSPEKPPRRGEIRVELIGESVPFIQKRVVYNGRRWMNLENYDPKKRYN